MTKRTKQSIEPTNEAAQMIADLAKHPGVRCRDHHACQCLLRRAEVHRAALKLYAEAKAEGPELAGAALEV